MGVIAPAHKDMVKLMLNNEKAVLCEKPLGLSLEEVMYDIGVVDCNMIQLYRLQRWLNLQDRRIFSSWKLFGVAHFQSMKL